jgi:hypothetical protein
MKRRRFRKGSLPPMIFPKKFARSAAAYKAPSRGLR